MEYKIKSKLWIELDNNILIGKGRVQLLKAIDKTGSLSKAAKSLKMSYKKAWDLLDAVNKSGKSPVTINSIGGKGGGGTILTAYGKTIINAFDQITKNNLEFLDQQRDIIERT